MISKTASVPVLLLLTFGWEREIRHCEPVEIERNDKLWALKRNKQGLRCQMGKGKACIRCSLHGLDNEVLLEEVTIRETGMLSCEGGKWIPGGGKCACEDPGAGVGLECSNRMETSTLCVLGKVGDGSMGQTAQWEDLKFCSKCKEKTLTLCRGLIWLIFYIVILSAMYRLDREDQCGSHCSIRGKRCWSSGPGGRHWRLKRTNTISILVNDGWKLLIIWMWGCLCVWVGSDWWGNGKDQGFLCIGEKMWMLQIEGRRIEAREGRRIEAREGRNKCMFGAINL